MNDIPMPLEQNESALCSAIVDSFGNREQESILVAKLARIMNPRKGTNGSNESSVYTKFITKVAFAGSDCWYWYGAMHKLGYGLMNALGESKAHRISWRLHKGEIPDGLFVLHKCDVRNCVNPDHLFLGTQTDNMRDMVNKNRHRKTGPKGEDNCRSKLTNMEAQSIREEFATGVITQAELSRKYNLSPMTISRLIRMETY